jgi:hypothetical protein
MAFVFGKAKKDSNFNQHEGSPGPGQYDLSAANKPEAPAPFHSSTFKTSTFDVVPTSTGPGSYNPPYQKDIQASDKKMKMSSSFCSKVERFKVAPQKKDKSTTKKMKVGLVKEENARHCAT